MSRFIFFQFYSFMCSRSALRSGVERRGVGRRFDSYSLCGTTGVCPERHPGRGSDVDGEVTELFNRLQEFMKDSGLTGKNCSYLKFEDRRERETEGEK